MSDFKEVWYLWDGKHRANRATGLLYDFGDAYEIVKKSNNSSPLGLIAYTLGEKRRRVDCSKCVTRYRYADIPIINGCPECNKGKTWEYAE